MTKDSVWLFDGLLWYLEARNWAFEKIKAPPHGSNLFYLRMHHSLFFVNLMSAVEHVIDYLKENKANPKAFIDQIKDGFGTNNDYKYVRELRNSLIHRGLDPIAVGHSDQTTLYVLCPTKVEDQGGNPYSCSVKYIHELAQRCREVFDPAISDILEKLDLFDEKVHRLNQYETIYAVDSSAAMPDWVKALAKEASDRMDFADMASRLAKSRVDKMRRLLAHS